MKRLRKTAAVCAAALVLSASFALTPGAADARGGRGWHGGGWHGGGWHGGGWRGGRGWGGRGYRHGGDWGWGGAALGGALIGAAIANTAYAGSGYAYADSPYRCRGKQAVYDRWGYFIGYRRVYYPC